MASMDGGQPDKQPLAATAYFAMGEWVEVLAGAQVPLSESWKPVRLGDGKTSKKVSIHS